MDVSAERLRLRKLIEHWAEHNEEHKKRFNESASEAAKIGLEEVSHSIFKAAELAEEVSEHLRSALRGF